MVSMPLPRSTPGMPALASCAPRRGQSQCAIPLGEHIDQWNFVLLGEPVGGGGVLVRDGEARQRAAGLQSDEVTEDLECRQAVPGAERDQLGADLVPLESQARAVKGLHEHAVEGEGQQSRVTQRRYPFRFSGRLGPAGCARTA